MPRVIEFSQPVDTSMFSAVQLQPRVVASLAWSALARWLRAYAVSFPELIGKEQTGLVVMGFHLEYLDPLSFFDGEAIGVRATLRVMRGGTRAALVVSVAGEMRQAAVARLVLCPVRIEEPTSLAAYPAPFTERVLAAFDADEFDVAAAERPVPQRRAAIETRSPVIAEGLQPFSMHRHQTEVADQWSWIEVAGLVEVAREELALSPDAPVAMRRCLGKRLRRLDTEFARPFFTFDGGEITSRAYLTGDGLGLVHRFTSAHGTVLHATVVEVF